ncbi:hypothetical protein NGJ69_17285 [Atlantibacter hermannii]|uniref:hypothetical protein n=1 Tax=Atlantibacter hermannii TaxID=565 RepID=UPI002898AB8B|nr:hypothetical protein [Atlantibacter hermannii]MEB7925471.1 hypothetical protein [Atlantibacter hermannii]
MAGLSKEQRAQREAEKPAAENPGQNSPRRQKENGPELVVMECEFPPFPDAPSEADVHPEEVDNWKAEGWKVKE